MALAKKFAFLPKRAGPNECTCTHIDALGKNPHTHTKSDGVGEGVEWSGGAHVNMHAQLFAFVAFLPRLQFFAAQLKLQKARNPDPETRRSTTNIVHQTCESCIHVSVLGWTGGKDGNFERFNYATIHKSSKRHC